MRKDVIVVDKDKGLVQVTTADERWYALPTKDKNTKLPTYRYVPSVTWITGHYPKGLAFYRWLAGKGWDESQALKEAAANKGSMIHRAIELLLNGEQIEHDTKLRDPNTDEERALTTDEWAALCSFVKWYSAVQPETVGTEMVVVNDEEGYAGTVDYVCRINGVPYIIDFKTGQNVWPEYELQLSAYKKCIKLEDDVEAKLAILQVGYQRNKNNYKFTEVEDKWDLFKAAQLIWRNENENAKPKQRDFPVVLTLVDNNKEHEDKPSSDGKSGNKAKA